MIATKTISIEVAKESFEVFEAMEGLIADIKNKKAVSEIVAGNLGKLMTAVEGFEKIAEEVKSVHFYETAGVGGARITRALVGQEA